MIRIATVFSGIGAPEEALKQMKTPFELVFACDNGERELKLDYDTIMKKTEGFSEDERVSFVNQLYANTRKLNYVKQSYFANNEVSDEQWYEDIRFINGEKYQGKVDILVGGSPCQSFSTYGKKQGFEDTRGTLFFHYANLIKTIKPKAFIYENVIGLKTHDKGNTWKRIQEIFNELDYNIFDAELNAKDYDLPQNRLRVFVIGFKKDLGIDGYAFPKPVKLKRYADEYLSKKIPKEYYLGKKGFEWVTQREKHQGRSRVNKDIIGCQTANQQFNWTGDFRLEEPSEDIRNDERIYKGEYEGRIVVARKLMPEECLRLMGFRNFKIVVNDKQAYRQSGNSIAVPVMKKLLKSVIERIE